DEEHQCPICSKKLTEPKILTCLHVFCEACLEELLKENSDEGVQPHKIKCPQCEQETQVPMNGVSDLQTEHVISDILDVCGAENIICTSCKAKEKAVARCYDCANFLCPNCVTAHRFMRCFDNHKVLTLDELGVQGSDGVSIHKPIYCTVHPSENLKYFCHSCETAICSECMVSDHKQPDHNYEKILDVEELLKNELESLRKECLSKIEPCTLAASKAESALSELQSQQEDAKSLIEETFQSYKAILEKKKTSLLEELDEIHSHHELDLMGLCHNINNMVDKVEDSCKFTEHVLKNGNSVQIASLKRIITTQLLSLINNSPSVEPNLSIEFKTDPTVFEKMINQTFGTFSNPEDQKKVNKIEPNSIFLILPAQGISLITMICTRCLENMRELVTVIRHLHFLFQRENQLISPLHSSFENEGFLSQGVRSPDQAMMTASTAGFMSNMGSLPPVSLSGNLQSLSSIIANIPSALTGQSHPLHDTSLSRNSHSPAMSDSGISVGDAASTNSNNSATMINIAAMANLGMYQHFIISGQVPLMAGLSGGMTTHSGSTSSDGGSRTMTPQSHAELSPTSLASLTPIGQRVQSSNIENLANLLNPQNQSLSGINKIISGMRSMAVANNSNMDNMMGKNGLVIVAFRCKFGQLGPGKGQFNSPHGFCLGFDQDIIVADTNNHRIQVFDKTGDFKYQFGIPGREEGQLWYPRKVAVMRASARYVVCDRGNERSRMQIFTKNGHFVKKIAIRYIDIVAGLAITAAGNIAAVDSVSPTVFCIAESGDLLKWFDCSDYMREPSDIAVSGSEYFVCDFKGHCVVVFNEEGQFMRRIGCENITNYPNGIDISDDGDVLIGDSHGNRFHVGVFQRDGSLIGEFQCPYVKVSRCCGLKITSEGYVVTLAKNNHHVLVLNTLYI
ncbi:hypothetical protein LOTGIDRAFT_91879, partial [Lottia gigantea]